MIKTVGCTILLVTCLSVAAIGAVGSPSAYATIRGWPLNATDIVRVSVSYNMQVPLADTEEQTLVASQRSGRKLIYRLATEECALLQELIAKTCRLTNINVSTQIRPQMHNMPFMLRLTGSAQFAISLKSEKPSGE